MAENTTHDQEPTKEVETSEPAEQSQTKESIATEAINASENIEDKSTEEVTDNNKTSDEIEPDTATVIVVADNLDELKKTTKVITEENVEEQTTETAQVAEDNIENQEVENIQTEDCANSDGFGKNFNWEMCEQNNKLKEDNLQMVDKLREKEREICTLEEALTTLHDELKFLETQEVQSVAKDLAKKNRKLTVQLERERSRCAQTQIESQKLKSELAAFAHYKLSPKKIVQPMSFSERSSLEPMDTNIKDVDTKDEKADLKQDINKLKQKLIRSQSEILKHKDIIKKLNIALKKEIGDDTKDMNEIIRDGGNWKGRAERIAILQNKLHEAKRELELLDDIGRTTKQKISPRNKNEEHKQILSQTATERSRQYEEAQLQMEKLQQIADELRNAIKAKNCRIKGMETNIVSMRTKLNFFVEKSKTDDSLIETLQSQLNERLKIQNTLHKKERLLNKNNNQISNLSISLNEQNETIVVLNETIDEMKTKIMKLTEQRTNKFKNMFERIANDDKLYQIEILKTENEKQKEMISSYKKNLGNLQRRVSRKASPREQSIIHTNRSNKSSLKVSQLKERMEAMAQEQQLVKASYLSIIEGKENEIEICRKMIKQQSDIQQQALKELKGQMDQIKIQFLNA